MPNPSLHRPARKATQSGSSEERQEVLRILNSERFCDRGASLRVQPERGCRFSGPALRYGQPVGKQALIQGIRPLRSAYPQVSDSLQFRVIIIEIATHP